jgi:hypothetical protein
VEGISNARSRCATSTKPPKLRAGDEHDAAVARSEVDNPPSRLPRRLARATRNLGWDTDKVNVDDGTIAIGHPISASGARVLVTLLYEMQKRNGKRGLCIGGGIGIAMCVEQ